MKEAIRKKLSLLLCLIVAISMCFGSVSAVFADAGEATENEAVVALDGEEAGAADGEAAVVEESDALAEDFEGVAFSSEAKATSISGSTITPSVFKKSTASADYYTTRSKYYVNMKKAGTILVIHDSEYSSNVKIDGDYPDHYVSISGGYVSCFYVGSGSHTMEFYDTGVTFGVFYAPRSKTITATSSKKTYYIGRPASSSSVATFKIKVKSSGYIMLNMGDGVDSTYSVYYKAKGFKDFEYLTSKDAQRYLAVKKGTYAIKTKSYSPLLSVTVKFVKKGQSPYGTKKGKAKALKKKKASKGLIFSAKKQAHWYKLRNPKLQKVKVVVTHKLAGGGYGGIKVTFYDRRGSMGSQIIYPTNGKYTATLYTYGKNNRLVKGNYWVKVESYSGGSGYFTVTWK